MAARFSRTDDARIVAAIRDAESRTSGEIRVHIARRCPGDPVEAAKKVFDKLRMAETAARNGVLLFLAPREQLFAVIGDEGIDAVTPDTFWDEIVAAAVEQFRSGAFADGLVEAISRAGTALKAHFPYESNDENELTDEIHYA